MRIIHAINTLQRADGGPPVVAAALAIAQARLGHEVHLVTYAGGVDNADGRGVLHDMPGAELIHLHVVRRGRLERLRASRIMAAMRPLMPGAAAVHIHGVWVQIALGAAAVSRKAGVPYVVLPHGALNDWTLAEKSLKKKLALALSFRSLLARAAWIHTTSQYEARCTLDGGFHPDVRVFPPGVDPSLLEPPPPPDAFGRRYQALAGRRYVVFIARLHPGKGADLLARAIGLLRDRGSDLNAVIAGPDAGARSEVESVVAQCNLHDRVHLVGPLYGAAKLEALSGALAFCLPSKGESFGLSIAEAMAIGAPVVITPGCHFDDAQQAGAGIVVERTPEAIAAGLARFAEDPAGRAAASKAGRDLVAARYSWPVVAQQIIDGYSTGANAKPR